MKREVVISAKDVSIGYPKTRQKDKTCLYNNLSFDLYSGELVCLIGVNGAGKSTLLRSISASQPILNGSIYFKGKDITKYNDKDLSQLLGLVLTDETSVGGLTVRELVELGRYPYTGFFGQLSDNDKEVIDKAMSDVCIIHKADSYVAELSDGERQKAMIAKVLAQECPVILLDEPTAFLDIASRIEIVNLLHNLAMTQNKTILLSTHDIELALLLADRLWLLSKEFGLQSGITEDIVLSGLLDNFFQKENIVFQKESGSFLPKLECKEKVFLHTQDDIYYWIKNLLSRYGYQLTDNKEDSSIYLNIQSFKVIEVERDGNKTELSSLSQLVEYLRKHSH